MIDQLYREFKYWSKGGSVYILSDLHLNDPDCKYMDPNWISVEEQVHNIFNVLHFYDTFICLGDVGDLEPLIHEWCRKKYHGKLCNRILITGNHDNAAAKNMLFWTEVYDGPLFISPKIVLSHEPIYGLDWCMNIHGHDHDPNNKGDEHHLNVAANVIGYKPINLGKEIKNGLLRNCDGIHRYTIDRIKDENKG